MLHSWGEICYTLEVKYATLLITSCTLCQCTHLCHARRAMVHSWSLSVQEVSIPVYSTYLSMPHLKGWDMLHSWLLPVQEVNVPIYAMYPSNPCLMGWDMPYSWSLPVQEVGVPVHATLEGVRYATLLITSCTGSSIQVYATLKVTFMVTLYTGSQCTHLRHA